jgi:SPP1 family phage portal protein
VVDFPTNGLHGRCEITTPVEKITQENVVMVLTRALYIHSLNSNQIDYLYHYMRGEQPILNRVKKVRPEICNKIVENHAAEITQFTSGYFLGEPVTYVRRGDRQNTSEEIGTLNDYMFFEDKASHDKDMATWMAIGGVGYRMVLPDKSTQLGEDEAPFEIDTPDPRYTFVVYHSGFGHRRVMGVRQIYREKGPDHLELVCCGYTPTHYFEVENTQLTVWKEHNLGDIPIFEYRLNMARMGSFEPAVPMLDAINTIMSNRVDGVEQFVQSFLKFVNCEVDDENVTKLQELGAIMIKSAPGVNADVSIVSQELNQQQTQTLVDYLYDQVLVICGMPTTTKGGASTSDTGQAVFLRDGWSQCEARARDTELLFKKSEKQFLRLVLHIIRETQEFNLSLSEVECKFTRRQHDNLQSKTQALLSMLDAGLHPEVAIATCGLFNDPMDVTLQSKDYLRKWEYKPMQPTGAPEGDEDDGSDEESEDKSEEKSEKKDESGDET